LPRIKLVSEEKATGRVRATYEDIKATMGWSFVPETFRLVAHNPDHLETYWGHYKQVMAPGKVDIKTKKIIAFVVSAMNNCSV